MVATACVGVFAFSNSRIADERALPERAMLLAVDQAAPPLQDVAGASSCEVSERAVEVAQAEPATPREAQAQAAAERSPETLRRKLYLPPADPRAPAFITEPALGILPEPVGGRSRDAEVEVAEPNEREPMADVEVAGPNEAEPVAEVPVLEPLEHESVYVWEEDGFVGPETVYTWEEDGFVGPETVYTFQENAFVGPERVYDWEQDGFVGPETVYTWEPNEPVGPDRVVERARRAGDVVVAKARRPAKQRAPRVAGDLLPAGDGSEDSLELAAVAPDLATSVSYDWQDDGFVGPPPAGDGAARLAVAESSLVGPPLPARWGQSDTPGPAIVTLAEARASIRAELDQHHGLPFDPLAAALREEPKPEPKAAAKKPNPFEKFLAEEREYDTVTYTRKLTHELKYGETMSEVLGAAGLSQGEVEEWVSAAGRAYNLNRVYAGQELSLLMQMPETELQRLSLEIDRTTRLVAERDAGKVVARREEIPYERRLRVAGGTIEHSLYVSAMKQGVPDKIISEIAETLGWEVNFGGLYPGASFRVVYEELARTDTAESTPGRVLAVEVENRGRRYEGFYFRMPDGSHAGYYNRQGEALGRSFLRYPVSYSRISSQFSRARFHPVLKRRVPHYGVDFAAPPGTPVKAVADGKVEKAGWYGGNGRFVKIRHDRLYKTGYAHLSRIARGLRAGAKVKKGQIIGYVGSSGLATGPHLHFAMYRSGKYIDPLNANLPRPQPLAGNARAGFRMTVDMMEGTYARAGFGNEEETTRVATATADQPER